MSQRIDTVSPSNDNHDNSKNDIERGGDTTTITPARTARSMTARTTPSATSPRIKRKPRRRGRTFAIGNWTFQCLHSRLWDVVLDSMQSFFEGIVLLLGPVLIVLALGIVSMLSYTFFYILVPMMMEKHEHWSFRYTWIGLHCTWVVFLLVNILFNYFMCVTTRNSGPKYDVVVREMARVTDFVFPETPSEIENYRFEYEDKMVLRIRRRREREMEKKEGKRNHAAPIVNPTNHNNNKNNNTNGSIHSELPPTSATTSTNGTTTPGGGMNDTNIASSHNNNITHRKQSAPPAVTVVNASSGSSKAPASLPPSTTVRRWMLMGPYEWGYCHNTKQPKPPRSHYDHVTKRLVLNLDHYCPWMFNSIGYFNYRYFVNFLIFVFVAMLYGAILTCGPFFLLQSEEYYHLSKQERMSHHALVRRPQPMIPHRNEKMLISLAFMICAAIGLAILLLGGFHIFLVLTAQTTIEFHGNWSKWRRVGSQKFKNPYSEGSFRNNWRRVYGDVPWLWSLLPSTREPQYLPFPVPGKDTRRRRIRNSNSGSGSKADKPPTEIKIPGNIV